MMSVSTRTQPRRLHHDACFNLFADEAQQRLSTRHRKKARNTSHFGSWISNDLGVTIKSGKDLCIQTLASQSNSGPVHTYPAIFESATFFFPDTASAHTHLASPTTRGRGNLWHPERKRCGFKNIRTGVDGASKKKLGKPKICLECLLSRCYNQSRAR